MTLCRGVRPLFRESCKDSVVVLHNLLVHKSNSRKVKIQSTPAHRDGMAARGKWGKVMPNGSGDGNGATEALADHLGSLIDNLANFRNKVDLPRREGLLGALQQAQQEAAAKGIRIPLGSSVTTVAEALVKLRSAGAVLDAVGVRELPGPGVYEAGDPLWAESLLNYAKTAVAIDSGKRPIAFPTHSGGIEPVKRLVPVNEGSREIKIAVVRDYGTGDFKEMPSPAARIGEFIREQQPDYTIHLGDVYYAGLGNEESKFLGLWPGGKEDRTLSIRIMRCIAVEKVILECCLLMQDFRPNRV